MPRSFTTLAAGCAALALAACGDNRGAGPVALTIDPPAASVPIGREVALSGRYVDDLGVETPALDLVWTSNESAVATIMPGEDGVAILRGAGRGSVVVTAQGSGLDGAALITVERAVVDSLATDPAQPLIPIGTCVTVAVRAVLSDGSVEPVDGSLVFWAGTLGRIAVGGDGTICGEALGDDILRVRFNDLVLEVPVEVIDAVAIGLQLSLPFGLTVGDQSQGEAFIRFSNGDVQVVTATATWTSDLPQVATVSAGLVTAIGEGTATISASFDGFEASSQVEVFPAQLLELVVTPEHPSLVVGATRQLTATAIFSDGTRLDVSDAAAWLSGSPTVATVSDTGLVTALAPGASVVSATLDFRRSAVFVDVGF